MLIKRAYHITYRQGTLERLQGPRHRPTLDIQTGAPTSPRRRQSERFGTVWRRYWPEQGPAGNMVRFLPYSGAALGWVRSRACSNPRGQAEVRALGRAHRHAPRDPFDRECRFPPKSLRDSKVRWAALAALQSAALPSPAHVCTRRGQAVRRPSRPLDRRAIWAAGLRFRSAGAGSPPCPTPSSPVRSAKSPPGRRNVGRALAWGA